MKYDIIDLSDEGLYCIRELPTDRIIMASDREQVIENYVERLNKGAGFNGWTPNFFFHDEFVV
jgi:hypothetical protein